MTWEYEHQKIKVEPLGKEYDSLIRVSKQDNHFQLDMETLPSIVEFLEFAVISRFSWVELEQTKDDLIRIYKGV